MHYVLFNFNFICIVKKNLKNMVICIRVTIEITIGLQFEFQVIF